MSTAAAPLIATPLQKRSCQRGKVTLNDKITGTATDESNNTSEFGANVTPQPPSIVKRAFELDGTPVPNGTVLPKGTVFKFLLYVNNPGGAVSDLNLADVLDAAFEYQSGTILYDNSQPACAAGTCTPAEEAAIFNAVNAGTAGTDDVDGDPVCRVGTTIHVGEQNAANAQLDIAEDRVFATVFTCRMRCPRRTLSLQRMAQVLAEIGLVLDPYAQVQEPRASCL